MKSLALFSTFRPFKAEWEKSNEQFELPNCTIKKMVKLALPDKSLKSYQVIDGGCANLNIKLNLNESKWKILRVYLRDCDAAYREQSIARLIKNEIPVPQVEYVGVVDNYHFTTSEFKSGITLRSLLLSNQPCDIADIMNQVGMLLAKLTHFKFPSAGFFDHRLKVATIVPNSECIQFAKKCLQKQNAALVIPDKIITVIHKHLDKHGSLIEKMLGSHLVHADFDPANILVEKMNDRLQISALLDWEFAFSGSILWDIANMLRYAHQMPEEFKASFITAINNSGVMLPDNWEVIIQLLNIISLLDCLDRADTKNAPLQCADIKHLLQYITYSLDKTG